MRGFECDVGVEFVIGKLCFDLILCDFLNVDCDVGMLVIEMIDCGVDEICCEGWCYGKV